MSSIPNPTYDFWNLLFFGISSVGIFYSTKLLVEKRSDVGLISLAGYVLLQSLTLIEYVLFWTNLIFSVPFFADFSLLFPLLYGPLLLIYLRSSFDNAVETGRYFWHFVPFGVFFLLKLPFYSSSPELKFYHIKDIAFGSVFEYYPWVRIGHLSFYCVVLSMVVRNNVGAGFMRRWALSIVIFFIAFTLLQFVYYTLVKADLLTTQIDYVISLASCLTILMIAWYNVKFESVKQGNPIHNSFQFAQSRKQKSNQTGNVHAKYQSSGLSESYKTKLSTDLAKLMLEEKLYRNVDLKLEAIAEKLGTNRHFISQVINEIYGVNFFEYINSMRIEEAQVMLRETSKANLNIIEIAYAVGFNNKSSFNSVFKKKVGVTPTEYRKSYQK